MLLLIPCARRAIITASFIYIPLCFYLYGLCKLVLHEGFWSFTFHYASTYTNSSITFSLSKAVFTFHYASTYTRPSSSLSSAVFNLHSTMLLLIRVPPFHGISIMLDLHSTMLLLIRKVPTPMPNSEAKFTFHYASTYTRHSPSVPTHIL